MTTTRLDNYINGEWRPSAATAYLPVTNPATAQTLAEVPLAPGADVDAAAHHAAAAFVGWRRTPATERIQYLFKFKDLLEQNIEDLARTITDECGKTYAEAVGELRRGIENVEVACGVPSLMQGYLSEDIASGIDELMIRQPVGVVAAITPFNFPGMIPLWFLPYAIACGNCFILKPSEKVPLTSARLVELLAQTGLPKGVIQLVHGGKETVDALLQHPTVRAISFVGSSPVARY
ncbi:MAG: aldehyde dehydrogenase family protein, partial [Anaerolineae bacterium]|nr:aldehyde dehydrogenase family protein [Anaerolineae bacterium]